MVHTLFTGRFEPAKWRSKMFYLINNDSDTSFAQQLATAASYLWLETAKKAADRRKEQTGNNWEVVEIKSAYTTQTFDEAHRAALDVPHMARD
jgi:hypothetical protein